MFSETNWIVIHCWSFLYQKFQPPTSLQYFFNVVHHHSSHLYIIMTWSIFKNYTFRRNYRESVYLNLPESFHLWDGSIYQHLGHWSNNPSAGSGSLRTHHSWRRQEMKESHAHMSWQIFYEYLQEMQKGSFL